MSEIDQVRTYCPTYFCGCETYFKSLYDNYDLMVPLKVYLLIAFVLAVVMASIMMGTRWFIFKDYYPLKQKSPILCIMLIVSVCGQMLQYPLLFIINFFTNAFSNSAVKLNFRSFNAGLEFSIFIIYLLRCLRITYAHDIHPSRSETLSFRLFKRQYVLALSVGALSLIKAAVVVLDHSQDGSPYRIKDFSLPVQLQVPEIDADHVWFQANYLYRNIVSGFLWHCVLVYCVWLHKNVNSRYSMKKELLLVLVADLLTCIPNIILLNKSINSGVRNTGPLMVDYCNTVDNQTPWYPFSELIKIANLALILGISIIHPLTQKKVYHVLLPTGRQYGFIKTMRDFLMQQQFLMVFTQYLGHMDNEKQVQSNSKLLEFWKRLMIIKLGRKQSEHITLLKINKLIEQFEDIIFVNQSELIRDLKSSISGLKESLIESDEAKEKYRTSINEKVDELEKLALERLDRIYTQHYLKTESYQRLKLLTDRYTQINLNMIMLNLAIIVD